MPDLLTVLRKANSYPNDEHDMYNGIKEFVKKHSEDKNALKIINEFTEVISGGTSLNEILLIAKDEAVNPTPAIEISVDNSCKNDREIH